MRCGLRRFPTNSVENDHGCGRETEHRPRNRQPREQGIRWEREAPSRERALDGASPHGAVGDQRDAVNGEPDTDCGVWPSRSAGIELRDDPPDPQRHRERRQARSPPRELGPLARQARTAPRAAELGIPELGVVAQG